ncbi:MAG TPA: sulfite reductase subunit alpha [Opitutaceae bacterium]|nr:sulfite reductase subunit alpha [Opitutaceae bacterium]
MLTVPVIPESAPFTAEQRAWLNGYLAGLCSRGPVNPVAAGANPPAAATLAPLTILFGSQTGSAETLAKRAAKEAGKRGFAAMVLDMAQTDLAKLAAEKNLLVITSTYGDGEPPDNAKPLHAALAAGAADPAPAPRLASLRFSVCALGDTNYTQFCKCGADFDAFLEKLGATRVAPRADCDLDFEAKFSAWLDAALTSLASDKGPATSAAQAPAPIETKLATHHSSLAGETGFSKKNPFPAPVIAARNLNAAGSAKQVYHVEFSLADSGLAYEAGDALGVLPHNCPELVAEVLAALGCDGEEAVAAPDGSTTSLRRALTELYDLGKPSADLLALLAPAAVGRVVDAGSAATPHHVIDLLLARADVKLAPADFVRTLRKLQPRLYSISSSPRAHAGQVHLTVGAVRYELAQRARKGVCSTFLADRVVPGESRIGVFVHSNKAFRPPANGDTPMIMVGPGTGIAPFRAFLAERRAAGAKGKNWLFFGDQRAATDFLYRDELLAAQTDGLLTRLDLAWSRDQQEKIYVQHRMLENAAELYAWLEQGAHFYVCGDASRMAKDVDAALHQVIVIAGKKSADEAAAYVQALRTAKRYARDVY